MSWTKQAAALGISGHTPREAVRGALLINIKDFQQMPDPLNADPFGDFVIKGEVLTKLIIQFRLPVYFMSNVLNTVLNNC